MVVAWHGRAELKAELVTGMRKRRESAVHCRRDLIADVRLYRPAHSSWRIGHLWHDAIEKGYGVLAEVVHIVDTVSSQLSRDGCAGFVVATVEAIQPGADLRSVPDVIMIDVLADREHGVLGTFPEGSVGRDVVRIIAGLYRRELLGDRPATAEWESACAAANHHDLGRIVCDAAWIGSRIYYTNNLYAGAIESIEGTAEYWWWLAGRTVQRLTEAPIVPSASDQT